MEGWGLEAVAHSVADLMQPCVGVVKVLFEGINSKWPLLPILILSPVDWQQKHPFLADVVYTYYFKHSG